ncbi:MAG: S8 family serine peptidase [Chloroflexi bacterium]|nr:hypothetical protein [Chloroflexota bacterium]NOG66524.1 S8 family serine peptidase [Chloroflexota bacterium]
MFKKLNSRLGLTFLIVLALLIVGIAYILYTSDSDDVKSARQNSEGRLVESDDVVVERAGNWTAQEAKSASSGSYLYSSGSPDDVLTLTFVGSRVEVLYTTGTNLGTLAVDVDHSVLRTVITADQGTQYQERTVVDYLDDGLHTLRVYAQEGGVIGIDAFKVSRAGEEAIVVDMSKLNSEEIAAVQADGMIHVIVSLVDPDPPPWPSNGVRDAKLVEQVQDRVLTGMKTGRLEEVYKYTSVAGFSGYADLEAVLALQANPLVLDITLVIPLSSQLLESTITLQVNSVRNIYNLRGQGMVVAVLDSGVDTDHPDLSSDIIHQWCVYLTGCPTGLNPAEDAQGHGTFVTGIVTSNGFATGGVGIAPDAKIVSVRITDAAGNSNTDDLLRGLDYILTNQSILSVDVINISRGSPDLYYSHCDSNSVIPPALLTAVNNLTTMGVKIFAASGNNGSPIYSYRSGISIPACLSNVIAVGATYDSNALGCEPSDSCIQTYDQVYAGYPACKDDTTSNNTIACFSNNGSNSSASPYYSPLDYLAPGAPIRSTHMGGGSITGAGTSAASPEAASVGLLVEQAAPNVLPPLTFRIALAAGSTSVTDNRLVPPLSFPRIDALGAVQSVVPDSNLSAPHNDTVGNYHSLPVLSSTSEDYQYVQDTYQSTKTPEDISLPANCGGSGYTNTVWFGYTDGSNYQLSISTKGSTYDTIIAVYRTFIQSDYRMTCNDNINYNNQQSAVNFTVEPGYQYFIMVAQKGTVDFTGPEGLHLWISRAEAGDTLAIFYPKPLVEKDERVR